MKKYTDRELDLSNQVLDFLKSHPLINIKGLNDLLKLPETTLQKAIENNRIPIKHLWYVMCELSKYGLKIDGYSVSTDEETPYILFFCKNVGPVKTKEIKEPTGGISIQYTQKQDRFLACDILDML